MSNFFVQELVLYRHFMLIDSPIPFELVANPTNLQKDNQGNIINPDKSLITGRDICSRPAGAWRVDCWTLLPEKYHKLNPVFTMLIKYDMDLLAEGEKVDIRYSDIDVGEGVAGVNGQLVNIRSEDLRPVVLGMETQGELTREKLDSILGSQEDSNVLLSAVRDAVLEVDNGSINNKVEQIRTVLKSSISTPSPFADLRSSIEQIKSIFQSGVSSPSPWDSILTELRSWLLNIFYVRRQFTRFPCVDGVNHDLYVPRGCTFFRYINDVATAVGNVSGGAILVVHGRNVSIGSNPNGHQGVDFISCEEAGYII